MKPAPSRWRWAVTTRLASRTDVMVWAPSDAYGGASGNCKTCLIRCILDPSKTACHRGRFLYIITVPMNDPVSTVAESLPEQEICREALLEKYAKGKERTVAEVRERVARALAAVEAPEKRAHWERRFAEAQEAGFIPAGRINSAAGIQMQATLINCLVQPVGDSISEVVYGR